MARYAILIGILAGGFSAWLVLNAVVLAQAPQNGESFVSLLFSELSSLTNLIVAAAFVLATVLLGGVGAYALLLRKSLRDTVSRTESNEVANQEKDRFISMLLHFVRTPLTGLRWTTKELLETEKDSSRKLNLRLAYQENLRVLNAVDHLLDVSRASTERIRYTFALVPLPSFSKHLQDKVNSLKVRARIKDIEVQAHIAPSSQKFLRIDKEKIENVLGTLFENAVTYTKRGGTIRVNIEEEENNWIFRIADTGIGIPKKDQPFVFVQFFRAENARRHVQEGFGVGLFMAKLFVDKHNGRIWFESKEGKGTTFFLELPLVTSEVEKSLESFEY